MTADAWAVIARIPRLAFAADRRQMTVWDLAAALSGQHCRALARARRRASVCHRATARHRLQDRRRRRAAGERERCCAGPALRPRGTRGAEAGASRRAAGAVPAHRHRAPPRCPAAHGPPDVVAWLAARHATAEAVDALLAWLRGGPGVARLPAKLSRADRWNGRWATVRVHGGWRIPHPLVRQHRHRYPGIVVSAKPPA